MRGEWMPTVTRTVDLGYEQLFVLEAQPGTRVRVLYGSMWLTEEGFAQDVFAGSGDEVALKSRGLAVVEGLGVARIQVVEPATGEWLLRRLSSALQAAADRIRAAGTAAVRLLHA